jgi:hypothetical protein
MCLQVLESSVYTQLNILNEDLNLGEGNHTKLTRRIS